MSGDPFASASDPLRLWSVTTLIKAGLGTAPGLVKWHKNKVAEMAVAEREVVELMLRHGTTDAAVKHIVGRADEFTSNAMERGTIVHKVAEAYAKGAPIPAYPAEFQGYVDSFLGWLDQYRPRFEMAEAPVYNPRIGYAGTLDAIVELEGSGLLVVDYKTTEHPPDSKTRRPPHPEVALQLCAYSRATEVGLLAEQRYDGWGQRYYLYDPDAKHEPMPAVRRDVALCITISPYDCFATAVRIQDDVWRSFGHVMEVAKWSEVLSKQVLGQRLLVPSEPLAKEEA